MTQPRRTDLRRRSTADARRQQARALSANQGGVLSTAQLRELGVPPWFAIEQVRVGR